MLIDRVKVHVKAGNGGNGCESFESRGYQKYYPMGGDGGKGGDIIIRVDMNLNNLEYYSFNPHQKSEGGTQGGGNKKTGKQGKDLVLTVPIGTVVRSVDEKYVLRDLADSWDEFIVARGGFPGRGNHDQKIPSQGQPGGEFDVIFDYRMRTDIALLGTPNSGKSSFLSRLTRAKVKKADFPYSTKSPQLGSLQFEDYSRLLVCDFPSIVAGSADGKGLGNTFLKHVLRSQLMVVVLEPYSDFCESVVEGYEAILKEVALYDEEAGGIPHVVVVNKGECVDGDAEKDIDKLRKKM